MARCETVEGVSGADLRVSVKHDVKLLISQICDVNGQ
jgi:hypothetical protein